MADQPNRQKEKENEKWVEEEARYPPSSNAPSTTHLPAQWKSSVIPLNRREQVQRYVGHIPSYPSNHTSPDRRYQLVIREQPQQCRMSGFGEKDRRPIDPAPIVQLVIYEGDQSIDLERHQYPLCVLQVSLWSEDRTSQLDTVQVIHRKTLLPPSTPLPEPSSSSSSSSSSLVSEQSRSEAKSSLPLLPSSSSTPSTTAIITSTLASNAVRTMTGTLSSSPSILRDQDQKLGLYFSFPDISVRVAKTYCLRFDLIILSDSCQTAESVAYIYSDPFMVYSVKEFPGVKESSDFAKHLSGQGLKVSIRHSVRPKKKKN